MLLTRHSLLLFLGVFALSFSSCGDDEDACVAPALSENIVGSWSADYGDGTVVFQADGTLNDPADLIYGIELNGVVYSEKTYRVDGDVVTVTATPPQSGFGSSSTDFTVTTNACDRLVLDFGLASGTIRRR